MWPAEWSKPAKEWASCFAFDYGATKSGVIYVAFATADTPATLGTRVADAPKGAGLHSHVLAISRTRIRLLRDGSIVDEQAVTFPGVSLTSKKGAISALSLRVSADRMGTFLVERAVTPTFFGAGSSWARVYMHSDTGAGFMGTRFSLGSSWAMSFSQVRSCALQTGG